MSRQGKSSKRWYDSRRGITKAVKTLAGLYELIRARGAAGYQRHERMNDFYVFGRYWLDSCGNCWTANGMPFGKFIGLPDVLTRDEFIQHLDANGGERLNVSFGLDGGKVPRPGLKCRHCGEPWNIRNCHDVVVRHDDKVIPLVDFVGKKLRAVKAAFRQKNDAIHVLATDRGLRNDRFIDLSPKYPGATEDWKKGIVKNELGWVGEREGINDEYIIQSDDEGCFSVWTYFHNACNRADQLTSEAKQFHKIFMDAGFKEAVMEPIPNQYCPCDACAPWFRVTTEFGLITIGWRKRVISIDWYELEQVALVFGQAKPGQIMSLFHEEKVTKEGSFIHAYGWDKAREYLGKIHGLLTPSPLVAAEATS